LSNTLKLVLITSTRWPYLRDIVDLMFLQSGLGYRFRYPRANVQPQLLQDPRKLIGRKGYLVHAQTSQNETGPDTIHEFLPVREATVKDAKLFGKFLWIYFEVGDWISFSRDKPTGKNEHHVTVYDAAPSESRDSLRLTLYEAPGLTLATIPDDQFGRLEEVMQNWIRIVDEMAKFPNHSGKKPAYLKMISIRAKECESPLLPVALSGYESGYEVKSDTDYLTETFQYNPHGVPLKPFPFRLIVDERRIVPLVNEVTVLGKYDFFTMYFRPSATLRTYGTFMKFQIDAETDMRLSVGMHVRVLRGFGQLLGAIAVAAGIALASLGREIGQGTITYSSALFSLVAALIGFVGLYYSGRPRD